MAAAWDDTALAERFSGSRAEIDWLLGTDAGARLERPPRAAASQAFTDGGAFVMATPEDHVFIDCGPVGLSGRGGHGHNDCLSFEAFLAGVPLIADPGSYVYTASFEWRNLFRSTAAHNTPRIDDAEQARLDPAQLWSLGADATPELRDWEVNDSSVRFRGAHGGYRRLPRSCPDHRTRPGLPPTRHSRRVRRAWGA
jgi:hypothetical protein